MSITFLIIIIIGTTTLYGSWPALKLSPANSFLYFRFPVNHNPVLQILLHTIHPSPSCSTFLPFPSGFTSIILFIISSFQSIYFNSFFIMSTSLNKLDHSLLWNLRQTPLVCTAPWILFKIFFSKPSKKCFMSFAQSPALRPIEYCGMYSSVIQVTFSFLFSNWDYTSFDMA
jgi:hypothetical protein